jgi:hypothetical protein
MLGQLELLYLLLARGAAVDAATLATGGTAFHWACFKNHPDCAVQGSSDRVKGFLLFPPEHLLTSFHMVFMVPFGGRLPSLPSF